MRNQPAGWYRDEGQPSLHRYWDGQHWSDWVGEELVARAHLVEQVEEHIRAS